MIITNVVDNEGKLEPLYTASGNAKCCTHFGKQSGSSSKSRATMYMTQRFHS